MPVRKDKAMFGLPKMPRTRAASRSVRELPAAMSVLDPDPCLNDGINTAAFFYVLTVAFFYVLTVTLRSFVGLAFPSH